MKRGVSPEMYAKKLTFINGTFVTDKPEEEFLDPKTGEVLPPKALGGPEIVVKPGVDPREEIWKWMVSPENPYFAKAMVNRVWAHYMGRGLIEPVDALSEANPPSHPDVMNALVDDFRHGAAPKPDRTCGRMIAAIAVAAVSSPDASATTPSPITIS